MPLSFAEKIGKRGRFNLLPATVGGNFYHADWSRVYEQSGALGVVRESLRAATGLVAWPFWIPIDKGWTEEDIVCLLRDHGVVTWGWFLTWNDEYSFQVKQRQSHWAQYVMLRAGVPLSGRLLVGSRAGVDEYGNLTIGHEQQTYYSESIEGQRGPVQNECLEDRPLADRLNQPVERAVAALNRRLDF